MHPAYETCHHCECPRLSHRCKYDPDSSGQRTVLMLACHSCDCPEFQHHPGWEPLAEHTWVHIIGYDGQPFPDPGTRAIQRALIDRYDPVQDAYWIRRPFAVVGGAAMKPTGQIGFAHFLVPAHTVAPCDNVT